jgi:hypothetical protein
LNLFLSSPQPPKEQSEESTEKESFFPTDGENVDYIVHLNDTTFDGFIAENAQAPILTMFYAPCKHISLRKKIVDVSFVGCGHCKSLKPELIQASIDLHEQQVRQRIVFYTINDIVFEI